MNTALTNPRELLHDSFKLYQKNFSLYFSVAFLYGAMSYVLNHAVPVAGPFFSLFFTFWGFLSLLYVIKDPRLTPDAAYRESISRLPQFLLLQLLTLVFIGLSFLALIIPGLIVSVFLNFAPYVFMWEGDKAWESIKKSWSYVRGYFWAVVWRMLILVCFAILIGLVFVLPTALVSYINSAVSDFIGALFAMFITPWIACYNLLLYQSLKHARAARNSP